MNKFEFNEVKNEVMDAVRNVLKRHGFNDDKLEDAMKLEEMMGMVEYGLFCKDNPECGLLDYFEV